MPVLGLRVNNVNRSDTEVSGSVSGHMLRRTPQHKCSERDEGNAEKIAYVDPVITARKNEEHVVPAVRVEPDQNSTGEYRHHREHPPQRAHRLAG